jgi:hypothetical protein
VQLTELQEEELKLTNPTKPINVRMSDAMEGCVINFLLDPHVWPENIPNGTLFPI